MNILLTIEYLNSYIWEENEGLLPDDYSLLEVISNGNITVITFLGIPVYDTNDEYFETDKELREHLLEKMNSLLDLVVRLKLPSNFNED